MDPSASSDSPSGDEFLAYLQDCDPAAHPPADECGVDECYACSMRDCPYGYLEHYHHDGCPACDAAIVPSKAHA